MEKYLATLQESLFKKVSMIQPSYKNVVKTETIATTLSLLRPVAVAQSGQLSARVRTRCCKVRLKFHFVP